MLNLKNNFSAKNIIRSSMFTPKYSEAFSSNQISTSTNNTGAINNSINLTSYSPITIKIQGIGDTGISTYRIKYKTGSSAFLNTSYKFNTTGWTDIDNNKSISLTTNNYVAFVITNEGIGAATKRVFISNSSTNEILTSFQALIIGQIEV